jgi:hypothetical protein
MKFLVIRKVRTGTGMTPGAEVVRAHKEVVLSAVKCGDADCAYAFVGGGGFSIQNANSAEDLNQRLMSSPLALFYEFEVHALADYGRFMETVAENLEKQQLLATLKNTWEQSIPDFNAAFQTQNNNTAANQFVNKYYDPNITVTKPSGAKLHPRADVLADFMQSCPQFYPTNITTMDPVSGKVIGNGKFHDNDHPGTRTIHFDFTWVQSPSGNWIVTEVWAT